VSSVPTTRRTPPIDEHVVAVESRAEIVDGRLELTPPADEPHGTTHFDLTFLLGAHVAPGYRGALDMLTRSAEDQDFAPDASVYPIAREPGTGRRLLDELSFEIVGRQSLSVCTSKARALVARGVRRVFCVVIERDEVREWSAVRDGWDLLDPDFAIADRCFVRPLPIAALLDAARSDQAVVAALRARGSAALRQVEAEAREEGREEGRGEGRRRALAQAVIAVLDARGLTLDDGARARVLAETDEERLHAWLAAAATATSTDDVLR
jgi:hypothetical protein